MRKASSLAAIVALIAIATAGTLAAAILGDDPRANTAAAVALLAGSILAVLGAVILYKRQPKAPSTTPAKSWPEQGREVGRGLIGLAAAGILVWAGGYASVWLFPTREWAYKWRYVFDDQLHNAMIQIESRPHDCEFLTAPIGVKHCHYEKEVTTIRVGRSRSGRVVSVSFDDGQSWLPAEDTPYTATVFVTWRKVDD